MSVIQFLAAFLGGTALSVLGYVLARQVLKRRERLYPLVSVIRQAVSVAYLALLFVIGRKASAYLYSLLIGGALGLTIPALLLTVKLLKSANLTKVSQEPHPKGRDDNG